MRRGVAIILWLLVLVVVAWGQASPSSTLKPVFKKGLWGYADAQGRLVIEPRFDAAAPFDNGTARVGMVNEELPELAGAPNLKWGYIDETGKVIVPLVYASLRPFVGDLAAAAIRLDGARSTSPGLRGDDMLRWGYVNRKGEVQIPLQYLGAADFSEGLAAVNVPGMPTAGRESGMCQGPRNFGYINASGSLVIQPAYTIATNFTGGRARVGKGSFEYVGRCLCCAPRFRGTYGHIDRTGKFTPDANAADADAEIDFP